jgi:branched-subunit amino acid aminotransferase/4-amino-4-deoxychorismate lyase
MLTEKPKAARRRRRRPPTLRLRRTTSSPTSRATTSALRDAKVSVMTHSFMYGHGGVRGHPRLLERRAGRALRLKLREHMERIRRNAGMLLMTDLPPSTSSSRRSSRRSSRNDFRQDAYIRPCFYKSG